MRLLELFDDEHIYSGLIRSRYLNGQMYMSDRSFFQTHALPYHWLRSQTPLCSNIELVVERFAQEDHAQFRLRLHHTPLAPWLLSYPSDKSPESIKQSGNRNNIEENPFNVDRRWKFCAQCVEQQQKQYGIAYWKSSHQLPGVRICETHKTELQSHDDLRYLNFTLPHHWLKTSKSLLCKDEWQYQWQPFIFNLSRAITLSPAIVPKLQQEIFDYLEIGQPIKRRDKAQFDLLFNQMRQDIGEACLAGLFTAYARELKRSPNILWITLAPFSQSKGLRHPLYWLSILFWLRKQLPSLKEIAC